MSAMQTKEVPAKPPVIGMKKSEAYLFAFAAFMLGYGAGFFHGNTKGKRGQAA